MNKLTSDATWPNGARLAFSIVVNVEEGAEMNIRDGDTRPEPVDELSAAPRSPIRSYGNESNYLYGIKAGAPRVFGLLDDYEFPATVTAAALALERAPELVPLIRQGGHEVACHGYRWVHQHRMSEDEERAFIRKARDSIEQITGARPSGWLSRYMHTEHTRKILAEEGFLYHMDDYSDDMPFWAEVDTEASEQQRILVVPYAIDTNDMKFWTSPSLMPSDWQDYIFDSIEWLILEAEDNGPRMLSMGLHLRIIGRPGRMDALLGVLQYLAECEDVWVATRRDIARAYIDMEKRYAA
ncbi:MAG: polysaccharide deacetylase family protein [Gammaproteobacteria bacterium]|nr:polysaccharide deacetylase family protein [Gammaproteobacteria bacterium]MCY4198862.1 polysaccharide deacetylase family protein [Gammaproteobacteria bacterium]MCY4322640.1 polysaccharide deacetylase family protein [Gammaproteobacteria bacterium]